jgi:hypothetical protein
VHGLTSPQKVNNLLQPWAVCSPAQRPHILRLQEMWLDTPDHSSQHEAIAWILSACTRPAVAGLELAPPTRLFASNMQYGRGHHAGVAILLLRAQPGMSIHLAPSGAHRPRSTYRHCKTASYRILCSAHIGQAAGHFLKPLKSSAVPHYGTTCPPRAAVSPACRLVGGGGAHLWAWLSRL